MAEDDQTGRWQATGILAAATLGAVIVVILFFLAIAEPAADGLHPTGFLMAATSLPVVLVAIVFWFIRRQDAIDRRHGFFED